MGCLPLPRSAAAVLAFLSVTPASAQSSKGTIIGRTVDTGLVVSCRAQAWNCSRKACIRGLRRQRRVHDQRSGLPGEYILTVTYSYWAGAVSRKECYGHFRAVDAHGGGSSIRHSQNDSVIVTAERPHAARPRRSTGNSTAENILQVLPHDVIISLPNANVADAIGRLPSVTLERDEGEGKYVQIRGTEPRYSNVTIDGVNVPAPESGVRQIKLDIIPSDLVESVEINKTLLANMDGDGIGGSVNLRTKTAGEQPTLSMFGLGGYTPIVNGREAYQTGATIGQRFGKNKKLGVLFGFAYDWNGRGIDDVEPSPLAIQCDPGNCGSPGANAPYYGTYNNMGIREYRYYRGRYGFTGSA